MTKRLLLFSNSTNFGEPYLSYTKPYICDFLGKEVGEVLFVPYAGMAFSYDEYAEDVSAVFKELGYGLRSIHKAHDFEKAVDEAQAIIVGGGNTFHLFYMIQKNNLTEIIRKKVNSGTPFIGWSAGSNLACPSLKTTNDMPIIEPMSFDGLSLIPFQINPHYTEARLPNHNGESREDRIREFLAANPHIAVVGLKEGSLLRIEGKTMRLLGANNMKLFRKDKETEEFPPHSQLDFLL